MKIWIIDGHDLDTLRAHLDAAAERGTYFRIAAYGDALKVKAGEGMWTPGIGRLEVSE